jgi:hypothetical protein
VTWTNGTQEDLVAIIEEKFRAAPVSARADFMVEVAHALHLDGDEAALLNRSYAQAENDWGVH